MVKEKVFIMQRVRRQIGLDRSVAGRWQGNGVTVAVLDTGIVHHPDFDNRIVAFRDFTPNGARTCYDDSGHGTHVAGCLAGSGFMSKGRYRGVAPKARLVIGKILNHKGEGTMDKMFAGLEWILENKNRYGIKVVNISVGAEKISNKAHEIHLKYLLECLQKEKIIPVVAAGNNGPNPGSISPLGMYEEVITVGCHDGDYRSKNLCSAYSGRPMYVKGEIRKPDVLAPGTDIVSCGNPVYKKRGGYMQAYASKCGTSMSTPLVSGAVALCLEKEPDLDFYELKKRIIATSTEIKTVKAGIGMLNIGKLLTHLV